MWEHLKPGSSPVDWCEGNYQVSANIAEFVNTVSWLLGKCIEIILQKNSQLNVSASHLKIGCLKLNLMKRQIKRFFFVCGKEVWVGLRQRSIIYTSWRVISTRIRFHTLLFMSLSITTFSKTNRRASTPHVFHVVWFNSVLKLNALHTLLE